MFNIYEGKIFEELRNLNSFTFFYISNTKQSEKQDLIILILNAICKPGFAKLALNK